MTFARSPEMPNATKTSAAGGSAIAAGRPVAADQRGRRAVVGERRLLRGRELRDDPLGQRLAQLDAPLIERVDPPDRSLGEDAVLIERDQLAERRGVQA